MLRFATFLAPSMEPVYAWIAEAVAAGLGTTAELHVGRSYEELADGRADLAFLCGLPYVHLADAPTPFVVPVAAPVLEGERYRGRPIYFSDVIVAADSPFRSFEELRGASWAFNEPDSQSGFGVVRAHLAGLGSDPGLLRARGGGRLPRHGDPHGGRGRGGRRCHRLPGAGDRAARRAGAGPPAARGGDDGPVHDPARGGLGEPGARGAGGRPAGPHEPRRRTGCARALRARPPAEPSCPSRTAITTTSAAWRRPPTPPGSRVSVLPSVATQESVHRGKDSDPERPTLDV